MAIMCHDVKETAEKDRILDCRSRWYALAAVGQTAVLLENLCHPKGLSRTNYAEMAGPSESLQPSSRAARTFRRHLGWKQELLLASLPTITVLLMLGLVETLSRQRLLFASLASSAFLIYLDPNHGTNSARTLLISQLGAAGIGFLAYVGGGAGYASAAVAMVTTIVLMVVTDTVHPPAVSTSLSFAFRAGSDSNLTLFALAVGIVVILLLLEQSTLWLIARLQRNG